MPRTADADDFDALVTILAAAVLRLLVAGHVPTPQTAPTSPLVASLLSLSPSLIAVDSRAHPKRSLVHGPATPTTARWEGY